MQLPYTTRLLIAYEGTSFSGWQIQPNSISIQFLLEQALAAVLRFSVRLIGSGRTDAGVHAFGQVAHFRHPDPIIHPNKLLHALNALLPATIRVLDVAPTHRDFHAQHDALGKIYHYTLQLGRVPDPFFERYALQLNGPLNLSLIHQALPFFIGTHDFTSFANEAHRGSAQKDPIRTLSRLDLVFCGEERWRLEFEGNGFLYKMVRNIMGTLLDIGQGKRRAESIPALFAARDRRCAAMAAPAHGLCLIEVLYRQES